MKTIRAKDLSTENQIIEYNDVKPINKIDVTRRGNIMLWLGKEGTELKFYNPLDIVVVQ